MSKQPDFPVQVLYDGSCIVCATEIEHYLRKDHGGRLVGVDIAAPDFKPEQLGIPLATLMYELHVIDQSGEVYRGIDAFRTIWQAFPASTFYGIIGWTINSPLINPAARLAYKAFARIRRYLPKRNSCDNGSCSIGKKR